MATAKPLFLNGVSATLGSSVASGATSSFSLTAGQGARFGTIGTDQFIPAVVVDTSTSPETVVEYVYITARATDTLTVTRAAEDAGTYPAAAIASGLTVAAVASRGALDLASDLRMRYLKPDAALVEVMPRQHANASVSLLSSGRIELVGIALPAGLKVGSITFQSGSTAAATPTNWWFGLFDNALAMLAVTADQATATWAAATAQTLAIATTAGGAASTFTTTYTGIHYLGIMVKATTVPNLLGFSMTNPVTDFAPVLCRQGTTAQTTPPAFPFTSAAGTAVAAQPYCFVGP